MPQSTFFVPRRFPYAPLFVTLQIPAGENIITGTLLEPAGEVLGISGRKAGFSKSRPATEYAGTWNTAYEIPEAHIGDLSLPQGATWARQKISSSGVATWSGRLPDGKSFTHSSLLSASGHAAIHVMMYYYQASVQGWQALNAESNASIATLYWIRTAFSSRKYPEGFPMLTLIGNGGKYITPTGSNLIFGLTKSQENVGFIFSQGGLVAALANHFPLVASIKSPCQSALVIPTKSVPPLVPAVASCSAVAKRWTTSSAILLMPVLAPFLPWRYLGETPLWGIFNCQSAMPKTRASFQASSSQRGKLPTGLLIS